MADVLGGLLGFYCLHAYPHSTKTPRDAQLFPSVLKGVDLLLYSLLRALDLKVDIRPVLQDVSDVYWGDYDDDSSRKQGDPYDEEMKTTMSYVRKTMDGIVVTETGGYEESTEEILEGFGNPVRVKWLNQPVAGQQGYVHMTYGNEAGIRALYTYTSLIVELPSKEASEGSEGEKRKCAGN